ncbi:HlyU family transcriptional regulator [Neptuniibacter caesariensis]|uniref:Uncharacterized protein n=1 Tax=Neptuniibacter caesariensis TaxID=207954 RepID=A0A7U8GTI8_NEPCE|nr:HlyU family transcriptional regulator [Neptuniibacter caesariensis]EAR62368.1 hypothetical protein MED92_15063 [Oceanospirillum sp. MED92] [Neptuniibacter caesariensis]
MSFLKSLGSIFKSEPKNNEPETMESVEYEGFTITPAPVSEEMGFRVNGTIVKGEKRHTFIRADVLPSQQACADEMVRKAKQMIDQQGDSFFQ